MSSGGWIRLDRRVLREDMKGDIAMIGTWVYVLTEAAWRPTSTRFEGKKQALEPGQLVASVPQIAHSTGLTVKQVRRAVRRLCEEHRMGMIQGTRGMLITVCNYSDYNGPIEDEGTTEGTERALKGHAEGTERALKGHEVGVQANNEQGTRDNTQGIGAGARVEPPDEVAIHVAAHTEAEATDNLPENIAPDPANFDADALYGVWWTWTMRKAPQKHWEPEFKPEAFRRAVDRIVQKTGIDHDALREVFLWAQKHSFWHKHILHPDLLLKKGDNYLLRIENMVNAMKTKTQFAIETLAEVSESSVSNYMENNGHTDENGRWTPF